MNPEHHAADLAEPALNVRRDVVRRILASTVYQDYSKAFQTITGLPLLLRPAGGFQSPLQGAKHANEFCVLLAARNKTCAACLEVQARLEAHAQERAETTECFAGLQESAVPVRLGAEVVAFLQTGQIAFQATSKASFRGVAGRLKILDRETKSKDLESAYLQTRVIGQSQYQSVVRLLEIFAQQLSAMANQLMVQQTHAEVPAITRARAFIAEHYTDEISLEQVARTVGMSTFYFCKVFSKTVGVTFTEYLSRIRVEAVKQLLLDPHTRVSEAAFAVGFQSLSQFNRVFHRIVGESPSTFRDELHPSHATLGASPRLVFAA